jgi:SAM-dependent methyltransferase
MERIIPGLLSNEIDLERETLELHLARYRFAARFAAGKNVLDIACGVGYGSALLKAAGAATVTGVDLSTIAIEYARTHYAADGITFVQADAMSFEPGRTFEAAISLETIEHLPDAVGFVGRLIRLVGDGGILVASVPVTLSTDVNPYHLHDFSPRQFRQLFTSRGLRIIDHLEQAQPFSPFGVLKAKSCSHRNYSLRKDLPLYYARHPGMAVRRLATTLRHGFCNKYLVLASQKDEDCGPPPLPRGD